MSCIYTYDFKEFKNKKALNEYIENKKISAKAMYKDYMDDAFSKQVPPTLEGFKKYYTKLGGLPRLQATQNKVFTVQGKNLKNLQDRKKTLSFRSLLDGQNYSEGDILDITSENRDTGIKVKIKSITTIQDFSTYTREDKDAIARRLGDYKDFEDMIKLNPYLHSKSKTSIRFSAFKDFINGEGGGVLIEYSRILESTEEFLEKARVSNPALNKYKKMLEDVQIALKKQIDMLAKSEPEDETYKHTRLSNLEKLFSDVIAYEDILIIADTALEDIKNAEKKLNHLLEKENPDPVELKKNFFVYRKFVLSYGFLKDIVKQGRLVVKESKGKDLDPHKAFASLEEAVTILNRIKSSYEEDVEPLLYEAMSPFVAQRSLKQLDAESVFKKEKAVRDIERAESDPKLTVAQKERIIAAANKEIRKYEELQGRAVRDEKSFIAALNFVDKDIPFHEHWMSAPEQSSGAITAMYSLLIKNHMHEENKKTIRAANRIEVAYEDLIKQFGKGTLEKMYGDLVEITGTSQSHYEDRLALVGKWDLKKYRDQKRTYKESIDIEAERYKILEEIDVIAKKQRNGTASKWLIKYKGDLLSIVNSMDADYKIVEKLMIKWSENNRQALNELALEEAINNAKEKYKNDLPSLKEWAKSRMNASARVYHKITEEKEENNVYGDPKYYKDLTEPSEEYLNEKWLKLYTKSGNPINAKGRFHKVLVEEKELAETRLPSFNRDGLILPGIIKEVRDRVVEGQGFINTVKGTARDFKASFFGAPLAEETQYGHREALDNLIDEIPVYYKNNLKPEDTSMDIKSSILKYIGMTNMYAARNMSLDTGMFLLDKLQERSKQNVGIQTNRGENLRSSIAKSLGFNRQSVKTNRDRESERLYKLLEMNVFGHQNQEFMMGNFRAGKAFRVFKKYISFVAFALPSDFMFKIFGGATTNWAQQIVQQAIEASGSDDINFKDVLAGQKDFIKYKEDLLYNDFGKAGNKSLVGQMIDRFDAIQGAFLDNLGENVSGTGIRKLTSMRTLYFHRHMSEYQPQISLFFGYMHKTKVKYKGQEIKLINAFELVDKNGKVVTENGTLRLKPGVEWTSQQEMKLINNFHGLNKYMNGVYNSFSKSVLEQQIWGEMLSFFRKYLYTGMIRRIGADRIDYEMDIYQRGYSRDFLKTMYEDLFVYKKGFVKSVFNNELSDKQKQDRAKTLVSFSIGLSLGMIAALMRAIADDEEEDGIVYNYVLYNAVRLQAETWGFWNPAEIMRILKSPTIMTTYVQRMTGFMAQLTTDPLGEYKRDTGANEKGDSKLKARFVKMLLGQTSYSSNPDIAVKNFENLFY